MKERIYNNKNLINLQQYAWYVALVYFTITVILYFFDKSLSELLGYYGVIGVIAVTMLKLVVMAENFRKYKFPRYWLLCYLLVLILLITIGVKLFL